MKLDLQFDEHFDHPVNAVWRAITDPRVLARWLMQNDFKARIGHKFTLREPPTSAWRGHMLCEVLELDPPRRMVWSWTGGMEGETETRVIFELRAEGSGTRLLLRHEGDASTRRRDSLGGGWSRRLIVLRHVLSADYACRVAFGAPCERVFEAVGTLDGLRGWWTPIVSGSADPGSDIRFDFEGMDEHIVMHVDGAERPRSVHWSCVVHTSLEDWSGTHVIFELAPRGEEGCELTFRHVGLTPKLACFKQCERGWDYFLSSLVAHVDEGKGMPFTGRDG